MVMAQFLGRKRHWKFKFGLKKCQNAVGAASGCTEGRGDANGASNGAMKGMEEGEWVGAVGDVEGMRAWIATPMEVPMHANAKMQTITPMSIVLVGLSLHLALPAEYLLG